MCMEDIELGRKTGGYFRSVVVGTSRTLLWSADSARRSILISGNPSQDVWIGADTSIATGTGFRLPSGAVVVELTVEKYGRIVQSEAYAIAGVSATVGIIEGFLEKGIVP